MLLTLALLIVLIQTPIWLLMIIAPNSGLTARVTGNYLVFILLGIVYIFFVVAALVYAISFNSSVITALASVPTGTANVTAEQLRPMLDALRLSANVQPALVGALLATAVLDLAGGFIAFAESKRLGVRGSTRRGLLLVMFLLGPLGMLVFGTWHYLTTQRLRSEATEPPLVVTKP